MFISSKKIRAHTATSPSQPSSKESQTAESSAVCSPRRRSTKCSGACALRQATREHGSQQSSLRRCSAHREWVVRRTLENPAAPNAGCHGRTSHGPFSCAASSLLRVPVARSRFPRGANDLAASKMDSSIPKRFHASKILLKTCLKCLCDVECLAIRRVSAKGQTWVDGG